MQNKHEHSKKVVEELSACEQRQKDGKP